MLHCSWLMPCLQGLTPPDRLLFIKFVFYVLCLICLVHVLAMLCEPLIGFATNGELSQKASEPATSWCLCGCCCGLLCGLLLGILLLNLCPGNGLDQQSRKFLLARVTHLKQDLKVVLGLIDAAESGLQN